MLTQKTNEEGTNLDDIGETAIIIDPQTHTQDTPMNYASENANTEHLNNEEVNNSDDNDETAVILETHF